MNSSPARPVSPSAYEPVPGWVDNLNGPTGLMVGAGKGVIRSMLIDTRHLSEVIPVDYAINGLCVIPYQFAKMTERPKDVPVYNITCADHRKMQWGEVIEMSKEIGTDTRWKRVSGIQTDASPPTNCTTTSTCCFSTGCPPT